MQKCEDKLKAMGLEVETKVLKETPEGRICTWKVKIKKDSNVSEEEVLAKIASLQNVDIYYTKLKN